VAVPAFPAEPIKAAPSEGNFRQRHRPFSATFASAQALVSEPLPHRKQGSDCLRIKQRMIFF
jgi:hypothetical protein